MRNVLYGIVGAAAIFLAILLMYAPIAWAAPTGVRLAASHQSAVETVGYGGGGYCARLQYLCVNKEELGEEGFGHCRRYSRECGGRSYCARLRYKCEYREELGEEGQGNCRRYRRECGGRGW